MEKPSMSVTNSGDVDANSRCRVKADDQQSSNFQNPVLFIGPLANPDLAVQTRYKPSDIKDAKAIAGSCGLYNLGNTCFMNSGIQCLAACAPLLRFFFQQFHLDDSLRNTLTGAFYQLLCKMWSGQFTIVHSQQFKEMLGLYHPQFQDYRQHDCQEFLALLLDTFHEQLNKTASSSGFSAPVPPSHVLGCHSHLNNEDLAAGEAGAVGTVNQDLWQDCQATAATSRLVCCESLSSEEETANGGSDSRSMPGPSQNSLVSGEVGQGRGTLKRASSSPVMAVLVSEDSNHSTISAHSTDSEQSSAFKKLKIESELANSLSHLSSVSESCDAEHDCETPDESNSKSTLTGKLRSDVECTKCVRLDTLVHSEGFSGTSCESAEEQVSVDVEKTCDVLDQKTFNNKDVPSCSPSQDSTTVTHFAHATSIQNDFPVALSPKDSNPDPLHYFCKETKTLNTNVLVSNFVQGDVAVAMDSDKFAKVDNRCQVPVAKEVNLLQEALNGLEEDKVEKGLIRKTFGNGGSSGTTSNEHDTKGHNSSNLRSVKSLAHGGVSAVRRHTVDPNLLNNSYDLEEDVISCYGGLAALHKKAEAVVGDCEKSKPELGMVSGEAEKMELSTDLVSSEVEKNVQMQALTKLKAKMAKSNIREDISDKASTSESTETEDAEMEVEGESCTSEEEEESPSRGSMGGEEMPLTNQVQSFTQADVLAANEAWEKYKEKNSSFVVDSFQGQFKSTVVCSECDHVSVTYEPFMYLSLPIPFAMERQICVIFIRPHKSIVRYMVTLHKNDKVERLRHELQAMTSTEGTDVVLAEVLDNHVSRILDDNIMLRYVNDLNRTIHAFQMLPPPDIPKEQILSPNDDDNGGMSEEHDIPPSPSHPPSLHLASSSPLHPTDSTFMVVSPNFSHPLTVDVEVGEEKPDERSSPVLNIEKVGAMLRARTGKKQRPPSPLVSGYQSSHNQSQFSPGHHHSPKDMYSEKVDFLDEDFDDDPPPLESAEANQILTGTALWEWNARNEDFISHPPCLLSAPPTSPTSDHSGRLSLGEQLNLNADYASDTMLPQSPSSMDVEMDHIPSSEFESQIWPDADDVESGMRGGGGGDAGDGDRGAIDQWQMCAICLEEMLATHLLTHQACSGVFCHTCLEMSVKHSGDLASSCPVCLSPVDVSRDFVPLASGASVKCKIRIRAVPVTFRYGSVSPLSGGEEGKAPSGEVMRLVCSPRLIYVASLQDASSLYEQVDRVVPFTAAYSLHFSDWQGLRCSRCEFSDHCTGCEVSKEGEIALHPDDNLTVHFMEELLREELEDKSHITDDASVEKLRSTEPISIFDCFEAFTQSEVLDEHNPWYCPCCRQNQCAKKTMTVWRYPDNLIIHLKRFVYEDLASTKIDNQVVFPHTYLDVTRFLAGPTMSFNIYDLYSIVCHYGGANSGHYTAYTCHPLTSQWYSYNDENVCKQPPGESEYKSGYLLFFKRQGQQVSFEVGKKVLQLAEEVTALQPSPAPTGTVVGPTTTAIVTFDTDGITVVGDSFSKPEEEKNRNYDFYN